MELKPCPYNPYPTKEPQICCYIQAIFSKIDNTAELEPPEEDKLLVEAAKKGDLSAFEALFWCYQARRYNIILHMVESTQVAEDLTQEAFIKVYQALHKIRAGKAFYSYLKKTATNVVKDYLKRDQKVAVEALDEPVENEEGELLPKGLPDYRLEPQKIIEQNELHRAVHKAIRKLPEEQRKAVILHHLQELPIEEVAKIMGCPSRDS